MDLEETITKSVSASGSKDDTENFNEWYRQLGTQAPHLEHK
jgi:hypothetical protein